MKLCAEKASPRFDLWLTEEIPGLSRSKARDLCKEGLVRVNGVPMRGGAPVFAGSLVEILGSIESPAARVMENALPLSVVFEDEHLLVVNKPRGVSTVTLSPEDPTTLADMIATARAECRTASPDLREAGLIQRLDFWTGGLVTAAKNSDVWESLRLELFEGKFEKSYLALVEGKLKENLFSVYLALTPSSDGKKMLFSKPGDETALSAESEIEVVRELEGGFSIVRVRANRARRHQVRAHLAHIGHPLVGDSLYGARKSLTSFALKLGLESDEGFLLHAETLTFSHPVTGSAVSLTSSPEWKSEI